MAYWTALQVLNQAAGELGLVQPATVVGLSDVQSTQLLSLLNSAGNELQLYYPWEQFAKQFDITLVAAQESYDVPTDLSYFRDQTQWDTQNHWPLLGPKSAQEWAWLKNSFVASLPRLRYRIQGGKFKVYPVPPAGTTQTLYMEYISNHWVQNNADTEPSKDMITLDNDVLWYDPWLLVKFVKMKFYELKGFNTKAVETDFMRVFNSLTGKDTGAEKLSLAPQFQTPYVGPWSIPDGSWQV
jgi:hypothetical protein